MVVGKLKLGNGAPWSAKPLWAKEPISMFMTLNPKISEELQ